MNRELDVPNFMRHSNNIPLRQAVKRDTPEIREYNKVQKFFKKTAAVGGILLVLSGAFACMEQMEKSRANDVKKSTIEMVKEQNKDYGDNNNIQIIINDIQPIIDESVASMDIEGVADKAVANKLLTKEAIESIKSDNETNLEKDPYFENLIPNSEIEKHAIASVKSGAGEFHEITQNDGEKIMVDKDGFKVEI